MKRFLLLFLILSASCANAEGFIELRIPCNTGEQVTAQISGEVIQLGQVLTVPAKTNYPAYTASKWASPSSVCASAVNAIHILINTENGRGKIISLIPSVTFAPAAGSVSYFALDMPAGTGIFGAFAPLTGSRVTVLHDGQESPITDTPKEGDILIIRTELPENPAVYMADIENRPGGRVIAYSRDGAKVIARVVRPVHGVGRFGGTEFQNVGRIRASHSGVIDIVTSRRGMPGGFQIIPLKHALTSHEMSYSWNAAQWMIIAPIPNAPDLEGHEPLYKHSFIPGAQLNDRLPGLNTYTRRPLILCRINGGDWEKLPEVSGKDDYALKDITHFRLYFPYWSID